MQAELKIEPVLAKSPAELQSAYFESAHGTAADITGQNIINPTATIFSACMMLEYLQFNDESKRIVTAVEEIYRQAKVLTPDQGGTASTTEFCAAVGNLL